MRKINYTFTTKEVIEFIKKWYLKIKRYWEHKDITKILVKKFILHHLKELGIAILALFILALLKGCIG